MALVFENLLLKNQLLVIVRSRLRAPNLTSVCEKLASHTDIIVRGDPKGSGMYLQVEDGSMSYSDLGGDPLPIMEKRAIARWIEAGAPNEKGKIGSAVR